MHIQSTGKSFHHMRLIDDGQEKPLPCLLKIPISNKKEHHTNSNHSLSTSNNDDKGCARQPKP